VHEPGWQWHPVPTPLMVPQTGVCPLHTLQVVPLPPQSLSEVPAAQAWVVVQHPVAQAPQVSIPPHPSEKLPHDAPQTIGVHPQTPAVPPPPHVSGAVQSVFVAQPQVPFDSHTCPAVALVQSMHAPPGGPQAPGAMPGWQLAPSQQAPLHACPAAHEVPHVFVVGEHACPEGQSPAAPQPHVPPSWHT
jgi:hypothetical protein